MIKIWQCKIGELEEATRDEVIDYLQACIQNDYSLVDDCPNFNDDGTLAREI